MRRTIGANVIAFAARQLQVEVAAVPIQNRSSWLFRYERDGKRREMGLGALHTRGLKEAREEAKRLRLLLLNGVGPIAHRTRPSRAARSSGQSAPPPI